MENLPQIIKLAQHGDKEAFSVLYKEYYSRIYRYCKINLYREDLAQDLSQETFIRAWKALPNFKQTSEGTFQAYLFRIARNLIIDLSRKKKEFALTGYEELEGGEDFTEEIDMKDEAEKLKSALGRLGETDRQILILRYFEDMSHRECAKIIGMNEGALRVRTIRALKKLKEMLLNK